VQTIPSIQPEHATGSAKRLLESTKAESGSTSNMITTMAQSPSALEGYLQFKRALAGGRLGPKIREQIALTVAQANRCEYSLAQHTVLARQQGLTEDEILDSREARAGAEKTDAALKFARNLATRSGEYSTAELRRAGYGDAEIVETVACVAMNVFESYFNLVARTEIDLPLAGLKTKAA
jgi:uncharacterized peroxidase-related enzyme